MPRPITAEQNELLRKIYYDDNIAFGRDKLYEYLKANHPEENISQRAVLEWLKKQSSHMIHQRKKTIRATKSTVTTTPFKQIQIDLTDMQNLERSGYKYMFNAVESFSKKVFLYPMKNREITTILATFKKLYKRIPSMSAIRADNEFNKTIFKDYLKQKNITPIFSTPYNPVSNSFVERMNSTTKRLISKLFLYDLDFDWTTKKSIELLEDAVNNTVAEAHGFTPNEVLNMTKEEQNDIYDKVVKKKSKGGKLNKQMVDLGDMVRIFEPNTKFKSRNWSPEVYRVTRVFKPKKEYSAYEYQVDNKPQKYKEEELLKIEGNENEKNIPDTYEISKIVRPRIKDKKRAYEVRWKGYAAKDNTYEYRDDLLKDIPKIVRAFERKHGNLFYKSKGKWYIKKNNL